MWNTGSIRAISTRTLLLAALSALSIARCPQRRYFPGNISRHRCLRRCSLRLSSSVMSFLFFIRPIILSRSCQSYIQRIAQPGRIAQAVQINRATVSVTSDLVVKLPVSRNGDWLFRFARSANSVRALSINAMAEPSTRSRRSGTLGVVAQAWHGEEKNKTQKVSHHQKDIGFQKRAERVRQVPPVVLNELWSLFLLVCGFFVSQVTGKWMRWRPGNSGESGRR
ncbi:hypothetical protein J6590_035401 [Homalodisca vitripennis]|nr:hypothetical protein J6590_035401 [Homalodisca vitripennis]